MPDCFLLIDLFEGSALREQDVTSRPDTFARLGRGLHALRLGSLLLLLALALPLCAQEFVPDQLVFPITTFTPDIKLLAPLSIKFGTGFCLDPDCRFVGTNYHVAKLMGSHIRIKGVLSAHRYLDSDPDDAGAEDVNLVGFGGSLKYNPAHDLA